MKCECWDSKHYSGRKVLVFGPRNTFWPANTHSSHGDRTDSPNKSNLWVSYRTHFNTTQPVIATISEPVNTSITRQQFTCGWTNTEKSRLRRKQLQKSSGWCNFRNCHPTTTTGSYNAKSGIYIYIDLWWKKNEKMELFEDLFQTMLKMQPEKTAAMKTNHFHAHSRKNHHKIPET